MLNSQTNCVLHRSGWPISEGRELACSCQTSGHPQVSPPLICCSLCWLHVRRQTEPRMRRTRCILILCPLSQANAYFETWPSCDSCRKGNSQGSRSIDRVVEDGGPPRKVRRWLLLRTHHITSHHVWDWIEQVISHSHSLRFESSKSLHVAVCF